MFTLGHNFAPANIHAGGLRLPRSGRDRIATAERQDDGSGRYRAVGQAFEAGCLFAQTEGIIPAPESCHAIAAAVDEANKCKESGEQKVILFNLSGHGLIDMASYDKYIAGDLMNYTLTDEQIAENIKEPRHDEIVIRK